MITARDFVLDLLRRWTTLNEPPYLPERSDEIFGTLAPRDRAFAFDLLTGVIRWRGCLDAVIAARLRQPLASLDFPLRAVLWLGAYQLLFQRGTSDYAAVDTTVTLAKKHPDTAKAAGLVNAVLRGITRLEPKTGPRQKGILSRRTIALDFQTDLTLAEDIFVNPQSNPIGHLAAVRSHPAKFVEHLRNLYGEQAAGELLLRNNIRPHITLRSDSDTLDVPATAGLIAHAESPRFLVASEGWNPIIEELVKKGTLSPQDPTSAKPVRTLGAMHAAGHLRAPAAILDLCAGLGTKSIQLARAFPGAKVTAADIDSVKLGRLANRATQLGVRTVSTITAPTLFQGTPAHFDIVLVDVPCSNTGVMSKRVQSRWRWPSLDQEALHKLQAMLLSQGASLLAPGGTLIYSTCSIDPAENHAQVKKFAGSPGIPLQLRQEEATLPSLSPDAESTHDGGYFAILC